MALKAPQAPKRGLGRGMIAGPPTLLWGRARSPHWYRPRRDGTSYIPWQEASLPWEGVEEKGREGGVERGARCFKRAQPLNRGREASAKRLRPNHMPRTLSGTFYGVGGMGRRYSAATWARQGSVAWAVDIPPPHGRGRGRWHGPSVGVGGMSVSQCGRR